MPLDGKMEEPAGEESHGDLHKIGDPIPVPVEAEETSALVGKRHDQRMDEINAVGHGSGPKKRAQEMLPGQIFIERPEHPKDASEEQAGDGLLPGGRLAEDEML